MTTHAQRNSRTPIRLTPVFPLLCGLFLFSLGNGLQGTLVAIRAGLEGVGEEGIGAIMSFYFIGYVMGTFLAPRVVRRVGHIRTFASFASIASAATLAHILTVDAVSWALFRAVSGLCIAGLAVVIESWMNSHAAPENRGTVLSLYGLVTVAAIACGQLLLNIADPDGFILFCLISILISLSLVPISLSRASAPTVTEGVSLNLRYLYRLSSLGVIGTLLTGLTMGAFVGMGATYAQVMGLSAREISLFMLCLMLGSLLFQWPLGWLSDRMDRRLMIAVVACANALVCLAFIVLNDKELTMLLVLAFFLGGFGQPLYSLCVAHANDSVTESEMLSTASTLLLVFGAGSIFGPLFASLLMGQIGGVGLFLVIAPLYLLLTMIAAYQVRYRERKGQEEMPNTFVSTYTTTAISLGSNPKEPKATEVEDP